MFLPRTSLPPTATLRSVWPRNPETAKLASFAIIGVICTVAFAVIYSALRNVAGPMGANLGALMSTIGLNFAANRRLTFRAHGGRLATQAAGYCAVYLLGLGASSAALWAALIVFRHPVGAAELALALAAGAVATVVRYVLLNRWVFGARASG